MSKKKIDTVIDIWNAIREETRKRVKAEPVLASFFHSTILEYSSFSSAVANQLANDLSNISVQPLMLRNVIKETIDSNQQIIKDISLDLVAVKERDPACRYFSSPLLFFKGFRALQAHKVSNLLWLADRHSLALFIQGRSSEVYGVDIHPAAQIGNGVMIDHATGVVIGETSVIENDVSIFQGVTLGGTGKESGDRHPKVREGVLLSAGATILGNVEIGRNAKVAAGSVVLSDVEEGVTVAGVPATVVGSSISDIPSQSVDHLIKLNKEKNEI